MNFNELLKNLGLDDATVTKIVDGMKANKIFTASEENLDVRYGKLKEESETSAKKLAEANHAIEELKKASAGNEDAKKALDEYKTKISNLEAQLKTQKIESAVKVGLMDAHVKDIDYMTFKLKGLGDLDLDDNGGIKGWAEKISSLKTAYPQQFESPSGKEKEFIPNKLRDDRKPEEPVSRKDLAKMSYAEVAELQQKHPDLYKTITEK